MGLCCDHGRDYGGIHLVYCADNIMEVCSYADCRVPDSHVYHRTRFRREANSADNKAATVAVDSLINFEAVKVSSDILTCVTYY